MAAEYELSFIDYLSIMRRRAPYMIGTFTAVFLIAIIVVFTIPPTYRSTGTIMVETQQIPDNIVPSVKRSQIEERINVIKQRVMTRENLLKISNQYDLFKGGFASQTTSELIEKMRKRIVIEAVDDALSNISQGQPTIAFTISFEDKHPDVALQVTNDLVTLFLNWNIKLRTEGASETTSFLTQETDKLKSEVDRLEDMIAAFKRRNSNNLPEQLDLRTSMLARAENDLYEVERDIRSSNEVLRSLEAELSAAKHGMGGDSKLQTLPALKAEYTRLLAAYTKLHPDVRALKRKIDILENASIEPMSEATSADSSSLDVYMIQAKVDAANARLDSLVQQKEMLQRKISQNEHAMMQTPKVAQELDVLVRERDQAQIKYTEVLGKKINAKIAESLESESKSERLTLLEPPVLPEKPFKPNRKKSLLLGFFLAIVSSGASIMVMESIDKRIRGAKAFTNILGHRPLVVIPYMPILEEEEHRKRMRKLMIISVVSALIAAIAALHFLYMPLDLLLVKILARLV